MQDTFDASKIQQRDALAFATRIGAGVCTLAILLLCINPPYIYEGAAPAPDDVVQFTQWLRAKESEAEFYTITKISIAWGNAIHFRLFLAMILILMILKIQIRRGQRIGTLLCYLVITVFALAIKILLLYALMLPFVSWVAG